MKDIEQAASVKCDVWEYEKEFKLFTKTTHCEPRNVETCHSPPTQEYFLSFDRNWVKSVDFGVFCPESDVQAVVDLLKTEYPSAIPRRAEMHKTEYVFEYKPVRRGG